LELQCREPQLEASVLRLREEGILEEELVELLPSVDVVAELKGQHTGAVQRLLAGGRRRGGLAEAQVRLDLLLLWLALRRGLDLSERLIRVHVLANLAAWLARRSPGKIGHRSLARTARGEQGGQRGGRETEMRHGGRSLPDCGGRATPCQLQARRWGNSVTSRTPPWAWICSRNRVKASRVHAGPGGPRRQIGTPSRSTRMVSPARARSSSSVNLTAASAPDPRVSMAAPILRRAAGRKPHRVNGDTAAPGLARSRCALPAHGAMDDTRDRSNLGSASQDRFSAP